MKKRLVGVIIAIICMGLVISYLGVSFLLRRHSISQTTGATQEVVEGFQGSIKQEVVEGFQGSVTQEGEQVILQIPMKALHKVHLGTEIELVGKVAVKGKLIRLDNAKAVFEHQKFIEGEVAVEAGKLEVGEVIKVELN